MYAYCDNNPIVRSDLDGCDWKDIFFIGIGVAVVGLAVLAAIPTGGGSLALASLGLSAAAGTAAAHAAVGTGLALAGFSILYAFTNNGKNYQQAKDNKTANRWAQEVGEESAESLKEGIVGNQGAKFNMFKQIQYV